MSIKERIEERMKLVGADRWFRVAFHMTQGNEAATVVMMFVVDELHQQSAERVKITLSQWRTWGLARTRVGNASMALQVAKTGVVYVNHGRLLWYIDEAKFWPAFEAAFALVFPELDGGDDDDNWSDDDESDDDAEHVGNQHDAGNQQGEDQGSEGKDGPKGAENQHMIEIDSKTKTEQSVLGVFERYRLQFTGDLKAQLVRLFNAVSMLGLAAARIVIHRCMAAGGRTWAYVAKALENEVLALTQPRQLRLLPVDVPAAPAAPKILRDGQAKNQVTQPGKLVIDGVEMIRVHRGYGKYDYISVAEYEREQQVAARAALEAERQRLALAQTFDDAPPVRAVEEPAPSYTGEGATEWEMAYHQLALQFDRQKFQAFVEGSRLVSASAGRFVVAVANDIQRQMLQNRLYRCVKRVLSDACGQPVEIEFVLGAAA